MTRADGLDGVECERCGGWVDFTDLGSVMHHEHAGLPEPWGVSGVKMDSVGMRGLCPCGEVFHLLKDGRTICSGCGAAKGQTP